MRIFWYILVNTCNPELQPSFYGYCFIDWIIFTNTFLAADSLKSAEWESSNTCFGSPAMNSNVNISSSVESQKTALKLVNSLILVFKIDFPILIIRNDCSTSGYSDLIVQPKWCRCACLMNNSVSQVTIGRNPANPVRFLIKTIITKFISYVNCDKEETCNSCGKS